MQRLLIAQMIDEVHTLIGAGAAEGAIDAANILKPALARGELQCIGATTLDEYRKHIEKDPALERRFQPVKMRACHGPVCGLLFLSRTCFGYEFQSMIAVLDKEHFSKHQACLCI